MTTRMRVERLAVLKVRSVDEEIRYVQADIRLFLSSQDLQVTHERVDVCTELLYLAGTVSCSCWFRLCHDA